MLRQWVCVLGCLVSLPAGRAWAEPGPVEGPALAMHLVATYDYPDCWEMAPSAAADLNPNLSAEDLVASRGFGYVCFLVAGVDSLTGAEFAVDGMDGVAELKVDAVRWCPHAAVGFGDILAGGGAVAFPCVQRLDGEAFIPLGCLPFEYHGSDDLNLSFAHSRFFLNKPPALRVSDCSPGFATHDVVAASGGRVGAPAALGTISPTDLWVSAVLWAMDGRGQVIVNTFGGGKAGPGPERVFPFPWVVIDGGAYRIDPRGEVGSRIEGRGVRRFLASGARGRLLRFSREPRSDERAIEPWDLDLVDGEGRVVFEREAAGQRAWISADGSAVAWQRVGHAGRLEEGFHLWVEGRGEQDVPGLGLEDAVFLDDGTLVGCAVVVAGGVGEGAVGDRGMVALDRDGRLRWRTSCGGLENPVLAASRGSVVGAGRSPDGGLTIESRSRSGDEIFTRRMPVGGADSPHAGRIAIACATDGSAVAVAWGVRGDSRGSVLALLDGATGEEVWRRDLVSDLSERGVQPFEIEFSKDAGRIGVLALRLDDAPAWGVALYDREGGDLLWRKKRSGCVGQTWDLMLSESGDRVLVVACEQARLYEVQPREP